MVGIISPNKITLEGQIKISNKFVDSCFIGNTAMVTAFLMKTTDDDWEELENSYYQIQSKKKFRITIEEIK